MSLVKKETDCQDTYRLSRNGLIDARYEIQFWRKNDLNISVCVSCVKRGCGSRNGHKARRTAAICISVSALAQDSEEYAEKRPVPSHKKIKQPQFPVICTAAVEWRGELAYLDELAFSDEHKGRQVGRTCFCAQ